MEHCRLFNYNYGQHRLVNILWYNIVGTHRQVVEVHDLNKDGSGHLSVNWGDHKPLVEVVSKWEDCSGRIDTFNVFVNHMNHLVRCDMYSSRNMTFVFAISKKLLKFCFGYDFCC